jgi:hypothetical protein
MTTMLLVQVTDPFSGLALSTGMIKSAEPSLTVTAFVAVACTASLKYSVMSVLGASSAAVVSIFGTYWRTVGAEVSSAMTVKEKPLVTFANGCDEVSKKTPVRDVVTACEPALSPLVPDPVMSR